MKIMRLFVFPRFFLNVHNFFTTAFHHSIALSVLVLLGASQQLSALGPIAPTGAGMSMFPDGAPAGAGMGRMPDGSQMPGGMPPLPEGVSEADFNAMVSQIQEQLEKMSPEEIEKLQKEAEEMLINSGVSREEIEAFKQGPAGFPGEMPAQPAFTPQAPVAEPVAPRPFMAPAQLEVPVKAEPISSLVSETEIGQILKSIIRHATALREQIALADALKNLRPWKQSLDDIIFYVKVFDSKQEHRKRLATKEFSNLLSLLKKLSSALENQEFNLRGTPEEVSDTENPYDILRISQTASEDEIEEAAQELLAEKDPKALKKKLTEEGASALDIKRQVQSARTARAQITEAYEKLTPPETRAQTDRRLKAQREEQKASEKGLRSAATALNSAFSQINSQLIHLSEEFLKKYEPAELARKKEMDAAEAKQRKEQEARAQQKASPAPYLPQDFYPPAFDGSKPSFDLGRPAPFTPSTTPSDKGFSSSPTPAPKESKGGSGRGGKKDDEKTKGDQDKTKGAQGKSKTGADEAAKKKAQALGGLTSKQWNDQLTSFDNELSALEKDLDSTEIDTLTKGITTLDKAASEDEAKEQLENVAQTIEATPERKQRFGALAGTYSQLEQMNAQENLSDQEKTKLATRYTEIKKKHAHSIALLQTLQQFQQKAAQAEAQAKQARAEKKKKAQFKESEEQEKGASESPLSPEEEKQVKAKTEQGMAALIKANPGLPGNERTKARELLQKKLTEDLLKAKESAAQTKNKVLQELEILENETPESSAHMETLEKHNEEFIKKLQLDEKSEKEVRAAFDKAIQQPRARFEKLKKLSEEWENLIGEVRSMENPTNTEKQSLTKRAQEPKTGLADRTREAGYPAIADDKLEEFDLALSKTDTSPVGILKAGLKSLWSTGKYYLTKGAEKGSEVATEAIGT